MLASLLSDLPLPLMALCVVGVMFTMRRVAMRQRVKADPLRDAQASLAERQLAQSEAARQELRLHEVARDAHAVLQTRISVLDQMVHEADREIARLEDLLLELRLVPSPRLEDPAVRPSETTPGSVSVEESRQFLRLMHQAGFSAAEIARTSGLSEAEVRDILGDSGSQDAQAA